MSKSIVPNLKSKLPLAIAKEKDGITMYWVDELNLSGLHVSGLARLLEYNSGNLYKFIEKLPTYQIDVVSAECDLGQGLQPADLYSENDIVVILEAIIFSNIKVEVRKRASDILKRLAAAGFKLAVMLELAPEKLVPKIAAKSVPSYQLELSAWTYSRSTVLRATPMQWLRNTTTT